MDNKPTLTFTEEDCMALVRQKYQALESKPTFYDYEKSLEEIWQNLGRQVLEKSLSDVQAGWRKKRLMTRFGAGKIANSERFSQHPNLSLSAMGRFGFGR